MGFAIVLELPFTLRGINFDPISGTLAVIIDRPKPFGLTNTGLEATRKA
jgi:hypothetical protein